MRTSILPMYHIVTQNRVLFVDDEPSIRGIYQMLDSFLGDEYKVETAEGGDQALQLMAGSTYDVVISDLTMPKMTGVEFLSEVANRSPASARVVVSGYVDEMSIAKCCMVGHRYFIKPFDPIALTNLIQSLSQTKKLTLSKKVQELIGKIGALPCPSETFLQLTNALNSNFSSINDISGIVSQDPSLTAKILQVVNSAQFGGTRKIGSVAEAVQIIGLELVRALMLGFQVFKFYELKEAAGISLSNLWKHCLRTAITARRLCELEGLPMKMSGDAFTIGLLHDIGKLILAANAPEEFRLAWDKAGKDNIPLFEAEMSTFGATHAQIGAYLLRLWGLPESIVTPVQMHHSLTRADYNMQTPALMVHFAQCITRPENSVPQWHYDFIRELGLATKLDEWRSTMTRETSQFPSSLS
jgi:putative nucleotidyltransferase with HDIG domain